VVSGLARGVDSAAHRGALRNGLTVAVLGSGADIVYPAEHRGLADAIAASGALVSEYPPGTPPRPMHFPRRNRLISGLSLAVVVVEAAEKSGSLITAGCALDQGREVMAVPGNVLSGRNRGAHALINDGAAIVEHAEDVLAQLGLPLAPPRSELSKSVSANDCAGASSGDRLLRAMEPGHPYDLDALSGMTGVDGVRLLPRLLDLELRRQVSRLEGGRFMRLA
jgi:DNA processing protein